MNVPDLPIGAIVEKDGNLSDVGKNFHEQLISELQNNFGKEGVVIPSQSAANITLIQNHRDGAGNYTCAFGTVLYNTDARSVQIAINNGSNVPVFKTVTLT